MSKNKKQLTGRSPSFDLTSDHLGEELVFNESRLVVSLGQGGRPLAPVRDKGADVEHLVREVEGQNTEIVLSFRSRVVLLDTDWL